LHAVSGCFGISRSFAWKTVHEEWMLCEVERRRTAVWLPFRSKGEGKDKPIPLAIQNKNLGAKKA